jgi:hypothetical protein
MNAPSTTLSSAEIAKVIPILKGSDMFKGSFNNPMNLNQHCLLGHQRSISNYAVSKLMLTTLRRMAKARTGDSVIPAFNDAAHRSLDELAAFWNQARRRVIQGAWRRQRTRVAKAVRNSLKG